MRYASISLIANTLGSIGLFFLFRSMGMLPQLGIALASAIGGWLNAGLLWWTLSRRGHFLADARTRRALPLIFLASLLMGAALYAGSGLLAPWLAPNQPLWVKASGLGALVGGGMIVYALTTLVTGVLHPSLFRRNRATPVA